MLFAMNFECKSTFKSLKIGANIEVTKHVLLADEFTPYRLGWASVL